MNLETLERMVYPGRIIIIGRDPSGRHDVAVYAITGRSPSSRARRLVHDGGGTIRTEVTDPDLSSGGDEKLLLYRCMRPFPGGLAVSNGAQTDLIAETAPGLTGESAVEILRRAFRRPHLVSGVDVTAYEPDAPAFTPRISGCLTGDAALAIVRRLPNGSPRREDFAVPLEPGRGRLLATYAGEARDPLLPFEGNPREVILTGTTPQEVAEAVFRALGPMGSAVRAADPDGDQADGGGPDLRVGAAVLFRDRQTGEQPDLRVGAAVLFRDRQTGEPRAAVINRTEEGP